MKVKKRMKTKNLLALLSVGLLLCVGCQTAKKVLHAGCHVIDTVLDAGTDVGTNAVNTVTGWAK